MEMVCARLTWGGKIMQNVLKYTKLIYYIHIICTRPGELYFHCISTRGLSAIVCDRFHIYITVLPACVCVCACERICMIVKNYFRYMYVLFLSLSPLMFFSGLPRRTKK